MNKVRRSFAIIIMLGMLLTMLSGCGSKDAEPTNSSATQAEKIELKLGHVCQETHPYHLASQHFADLVKEKSDGRIEITIYPSRQLGTDPDMLEMIMTGSLDMGSISSCVFSSYTPLLDALQLPFLLDSYDVLDKAIPSNESQALLDGLSDINLKGLAIYECGQRYFNMRNEPINSVEDLNGVKIRVAPAPLHLDIFNAINASPTPMPYGEIYSALQTGVIDGTEMDLSAIVAEKHYEVAPYITESGHFTFPFALTMNNDLWKSLSPEDQAIFEEAAQETYVFNHKNVRDLDQKAIEFLEGEGIQFNQISEEAIAEFIENEQDVYEKYEAKDPRVKAFVDYVQSLKK